MNEVSKNYWCNVCKRLKRLARLVLDISVPAAVVASVNTACYVINEKLHDLYINTIVNSLITLALNIAGMLIAIIAPYGFIISMYIAAVLFLCSIVFFVIRLIRYFKNYGRTAFHIGKSIVVAKSVSIGIESYVYQQFPVIAFTYAGIDIAAKYLPSLKQMPSLNRTIELFIHIFWKSLLIYVLVIALYTIGVYWIVKPALLKSFVGLKLYEVYFFPLYQFMLFIKQQEFL